MQRQRGVQGRDSEAGAVHRQPEVLVRERAGMSISHQERSHQDPVRWSIYHIHNANAIQDMIIQCDRLGANMELQQITCQEPMGATGMRCFLSLR